MKSWKDQVAKIVCSAQQGWREDRDDDHIYCNISMKDGSKVDGMELSFIGADETTEVYIDAREMRINPPTGKDVFAECKIVQHYGDALECIGRRRRGK